MFRIYRSRQFRALVVVVCSVVAVSVGYYGALLVIESFRGHGSFLGGAILFAVGMFLLGLAVAIVVLAKGTQFSPHSHNLDRTDTTSDSPSLRK